MQVKEYKYKTFTFESFIDVSIDSVKFKLIENKDKIITNFSDVYKISEVFDYCILNINSFLSILIKKNNIEKILLQSQDRNNPTFQLFEMIVNMAGFKNDEISKIKEQFFYKEGEVYYFYKKIELLEGEIITSVLKEILNTPSDNKEYTSTIINKLLSYISRNKDLIVCRKNIDILERTHYDVILNPKVAINNDSKLEILDLLKQIDPLCR